MALPEFDQLKPKKRSLPDISTLKKKEESVSAEPLPDSSTNIIGQTSTEADTLEQEVPERPLIYRHGDYDPLGVTQREEPKDYSQADIQEDTQGDPILQSLQEYGEEPVEIDFDEGIANAITTAGLDRDVDFTESPFVGRGMSGASQRQEVDENLKEDVAWNYFQERYRQVPPDQLLLLEGALERNAPNKYAQYRLKKHRAAKDRADQEWTMPEDTREYLELKNEYGQSDEMLKLLKEGKNQAVLDMLSNLDKQGLLNESQSKGVQKILSSEDTEDKTLEIGGTFAPSPQMPQQKRWNFPIDSKATTSFLRELVKEGDYFEDDIKPDDNSFTKGRKGFKHALHITNLALSKDKDDVIGALEYTRQKNFRKKPEQQHDLLSMQGIGEMAGGVADQTAATLGAGFLASAVGTPLAGTVASVATSTGMSAYQGYGQSLEEAYNKGRDMGLSKEKAYELAESQAMVGSALSGVEGFAGGLVGSAVPKTGFLKQAMSVAKDILVEGGVAGGSKMLQNWYGESLGLDYTTFEGVPENILGEVMFGVGMGAGNLSAKGFHNRFIKLPREEKLKTLAKLDQMIAIEAQRNPNIIEVAYGDPKAIESDVDLQKTQEYEQKSFTEKKRQQARAKRLGEPTVPLPQETPVEMTPKGGERMSIYEIADKQKGTKDASLSEIKARVLTPEEALESKKDRAIQTVKDAIAEAEQTGQVPTINGIEVSEATIDEINIEYEQELAELQQETDATIQPTDVEEGLDTETTGTEGTPVTQELEGTEQVTGTGEGIREGDPTDTRGLVAEDDVPTTTETDISEEDINALKKQIKQEEWDIETEDQLNEFIKKADKENKEFEQIAKEEAKSKKLTESSVDAEYEVDGVKQKENFEVRTEEDGSLSVFKKVDGKETPLTAEPPKKELAQIVDDEIYNVTRKNGKFSVSKVNENGKNVAVRDSGIRAKAIEQFKSEYAKLSEEYKLQKKQKAAAIKAFKEAQKQYAQKATTEAGAEVELFKKEQDDKVIAWLESREKEIDEGTKNVTGSNAAIVVKGAKVALQKIKQRYEAGEPLSKAISDVYTSLKDDKIYKGTELEFKKWVLEGIESGKFKTEGDIDPKAKAEGTGRAGTTKTEDTDGGQDKGKQSRAKGEDTEGDDVLSKEKPPVQKPSTEIDKILDAPDLKNKGLTDEELNRKTELEGLIKEAKGDAKKDLQAEYDALKAKQKEFDDNYLKKFSTVRKAYNEIKSAFNKGKRGERTDIANRLAQVKTALRQFIKENKDSFKKVEGADVPSISTKINNLNPRAKDLEGEIDRVVTELEAILVKSEDNFLRDKITNKITSLSKKLKDSKTPIEYKNAIRDLISIKNRVKNVSDKNGLLSAVERIESSLKPKGDRFNINDIQNDIDAIKSKLPEVTATKEMDALESSLEEGQDNLSKEKSEALDRRIKGFGERNLDTLSDDVRDKIYKIADIPLEGMNDRQKIDIVRQLELAAVNDSDSGLGKLFDMAEGMGKAKDSSAKMSDMTDPNKVQKKVSSLLDTFGSFTQNIESVANTDEDATQIRKIVLEPATRANARKNNEVKDILGNIVDVYVEKRKKNQDIDSAENSYDRSIYSTLSMYTTDADRASQYQSSVGLIQQTVDYYNKNPKQAKDDNIDVDALNKVWNKYKGVEQSDLDSIVAKDNKDIVNAYEKTYEKDIKDRLFETNRLYKGEVLPIVKRYTGTNIKKVGEVSEIKNPMEEGGASYVSNLTPRTSSARKKKLFKYGDNSILDLNFDTVQERKINESLSDIHFTPAINKIKGGMSDASFKNKIGEDNVKKLTKQANSYFNDAIGGYVDEDTKPLNKALHQASDIAYAATLGNPEQAIKQTIPVLTSAAINLGNEAGLLFKGTSMLMNSDFKDAVNNLMKDTDIGQRSFKSTENPYNNSRIKKESTLLAKKINEFYRKRGYKERVSASDIALKFTEMGDSWAAKSSWLAYYMKSLKKQGIDINDPKSFSKLNDDAASFASQQVSKTQNISDSNERAKLFKEGKFGSALLFKTILAYQQFNMNNKARLFNDLSKGNTRGVVSAVVEDVMFNGLSGLIGTGVMGAITKSFFDDDEEPKYTRTEKAIRNMAKLPKLFNPLGVFGGLADDVFMYPVNKAHYLLTRDGLETYAEYLDNRVLSKEYRFDNDKFGVIGKVIGMGEDMVDDAGVLLFDEVTQKTPSGFHYEALTNEAKGVAFAHMLFTIASRVTFVGQVERELKKQKRKILKNSKVGTGAKRRPSRPSKYKSR